MREGDDELLRRARLFVDSRATTIGHIGEIQIPLDAGTIRESDILADFYDLPAGAYAIRAFHDVDGDGRLVGTCRATEVLAVIESQERPRDPAATRSA